MILILPFLLIAAFLFQTDSSNLLERWGVGDVSTAPPRAGPPHRGDGRHRISKISILFGQTEAYEQALDTHRRHNAVHGYVMNVLREPLTDGYWNKLLYILSLMVQELGKPTEQRVEWFMWDDAHTVLLNPHIPLDIFLPPSDRDFRPTHFIGTRHDGNFVPSIFFIRVHSWSIKLLIKAMAVPMIDELAELGSVMDQRALSYILNETEFRDAVVYQPWGWFDASAREAEATGANPKEWTRGSFMAQFPSSMKGSRWKRMADCLERLNRKDAERPAGLEDSFYPKEIEDFWARAKNVNFVLLVMQELQRSLDAWNEDVADVTSQLEDVLNYGLDQRTPAVEAIESAKELMKTVKPPRKAIEDKGQWIEPA